MLQIASYNGEVVCFGYAGNRGIRHAGRPAGRECLWLKLAADRSSSRIQRQDLVVVGRDQSRQPNLEARRFCNCALVLDETPRTIIQALGRRQPAGASLALPAPGPFR